MGMDEEQGVRERAEKFAQAAAPALAAAAAAVAPVLGVIAGQFKAAAESAGQLFTSLRSSFARPAARKPCAWCAEMRKRPATHTVKWREPIVFWDDYDAPVYWPAGRAMRMCEFHARIAERYNGVQAYRFRRL